MSFTAVTVGLASVSLVLRSTCQALDNVCPGGVQVLFVLGSDIMHDHYSLLQHCGSKMWQIRGGGFVYCDYVICNAFQYAGEKVGHMRHRSSSEDFKGPDRPSCRQSQMLGVWSAHVTADPLTADPKKYCVICQLAILHEGLLQCRPYRLPTSIVH